MTTKIISKAELLGPAPKDTPDDLTDDALAARINAALLNAKHWSMPAAFIDLTPEQTQRALRMLGREYPGARVDPETRHLEIPIRTDADRVQQFGRDVKKALLVEPPTTTDKDAP